MLKSTNQILSGEMRENSGHPVAGYRLPQIQMPNGVVPSNGTSNIKGL